MDHGPKLKASCMLAISRRSVAAAALVGHGTVTCRFADGVQGVMLQGGEHHMHAADGPPPSSLNETSRKDLAERQGMEAMSIIELARRTDDAVSGRTWAPVARRACWAAEEVERNYRHHRRAQVPQQRNRACAAVKTHSPCAAQTPD